MLETCKVSNDAAEKYLLLLKTNWEYLSCNIMTPKYHQSLAMIIFEKWLKINPSSLIDTLEDYKTKTDSEYPITHKILEIY